MPGAEGLTEPRKGFEAGAPAEPDRQPAELAGTGSLGGGDRPVGLRERPPGTVEQPAARLGQPDLAARADEEVGAELLLELPAATLSGGWAMCRRMAARLKLSSSATTTKYRR
jgi:hypothetical protein